MEEVRRQGEEIVLSLSLDELRLITATINEARNGPHAIPAEDWDWLIGQPPESARALLISLLQILER